VETQREVSDEVRQTTCYMCACRCGINVHLKSGKVAYIEGNRDHPINKGVLCAKGASGIMQVTAPSRLKAPLRRVGPRGSGAFEEISWEEALSTAVSWMKPLRETAPEKLAFFTGRDQSQSLTGWWAQNFGTPNYAAHGGFCSVNMAAGGIYTIGGAFWEFGQPDWDRTKLFVMFGVAEDHDSNPIKIGIGKLKARGARVISVNPVRTGYSAVADDWIGITPGTDGLLILSLIHCLLEAGKIDLDYLAQWTNAPLLLNEAEGPEKGLFVRNAESQPFVIDRRTGHPAPWDGKAVEPDLGAEWQGHRTVFRHMVEEYLKPDYAPEAVAVRCGVTAERIRQLAAELAETAFDHAITLDRPWVDFRGNEHPNMPGRPVSFHAMRGISAHSNGFQTARALHLLQILLGSLETPGGYRLKPPYPKPIEAHPTPHFVTTPGKPLTGPHLGYVRSPDDLCLLPDGSPARIDKGFSWENPFSAHGLMHMVIPNAHAGDPYKIDTLFLYMANMSWNSSMNSARVMEMLTERGADGEYLIPRIIYSDAYASEMVAYADLILPDTTYLERHDCISLLDRPISEPDAAGDAIRWPVLEPDREVRCFQSVLLDLGARLGLPGMVAEDGSPKYRDYADYIVNHQRRPGVGPLMGFRGNGEATGRGAPNPEQMQQLHRERGLLPGACARGGGLLQAVERGLSGLGGETGAVRDAAALPFQHLVRTYASLPTGRRRFWSRASRPTTCASGFEAGDASAAGLVRALRRRGFCLWLSGPCADPAPDGHVSLLGQPERLAPADQGAELSLSAVEYLGGARVPARRLGKGVLAGRDHSGAGGAYGRTEREHRLDLERHRQAQGGLGAGCGGAGGDDGVPPEPPDLRAAAGEGRAALELRSCDRAGRLVRPAGAGGAGGGG